MFDLSKIESEKGFSPIKPGEAVKVILEKIEISEEGHLDFLFKGVETDNAGSFKPRYWANNFDPNDDKYDVQKAENLLKQIRQIIEAYVPESKANLVKGNTWVQFAASIKNVLTPDVYKDVIASMKIIYQKNSDTKTALPYFGSFISTDLKPRGLSLRDTKDNNGIPYERVLPLTHYGVKPSEDSPSGFGDASDIEEDVPAFGM